MSKTTQRRNTRAAKRCKRKGRPYPSSDPAASPANTGASSFGPRESVQSLSETLEDLDLDDLAVGAPVNGGDSGGFTARDCALFRERSGTGDHCSVRWAALMRSGSSGTPSAEELRSAVSERARAVDAAREKRWRRKEAKARDRRERRHAEEMKGLAEMLRMWGRDVPEKKRRVRWCSKVEVCGADADEDMEDDLRPASSEDDSDSDVEAIKVMTSPLRSPPMSPAL
ncbi:hypothetical protein Rhopal_000945-T1 [Rhodotorula paludigena]|uniref:BZIP domain-containing protein n=1 Tax=Rhodotorula paludigena TaxID=86838 RepID=A0AAV5GEC6_9BASI|nr:hypothetical protein Rhopal_000945-T1 [Rhodotorula paludigena]